MPGVAITQVGDFKRGDTFSVCIYAKDAITKEPLDLTDAIIKSQVRSSLGKLCAELTVTKDVVVTNRCYLQAASEVTKLWPADCLVYFDIETIINGVTRSSATLSVYVIKDQTYGEVE